MSNEDKFIAHLVKKCINNGITLKLINREYITDEGSDDSTAHSGFFGGSYRNYILAVATKKNKEDWLGVLVHEYCHFLQLKNGSPANKSLNKIRTRYGNALDTYFYWIDGKKIRESDAHIAADLVRNMELENEKFAIETIKKWKLRINIREYIKKANAYIFWYTFSKKYRKWFNYKSPESIKGIIKIMPSELMDNEYYDKLPEKYERFAIHCL